LILFDCIIIIRLIWYQTHLFLSGYAASESRWLHAHTVNVISDLFCFAWFITAMYISCAFLCLLWHSNTWLDPNSLPQCLHLKFKNCLFDLLFARLVQGHIGNLSKCTACNLCCTAVLGFFDQAPTCNVYCEQRLECQKQLKLQGSGRFYSKSMSKRQESMILSIWSLMHCSEAAGWSFIYFQCQRWSHSF
jgi:hypothetical protein